MADLSTTIRNALYDHLVRGTQHTVPAGTFLGLSVNGTSEMSGNGYARIDVRASFGAPTDGVGTTTADEEFAAATGSNWGSVTHAALFSAVSAGTQLTQWKALATARTVNVGDVLRFPAGDLDFSVS